MAPDHADRRRLARAAVDEGWTVRETEARAREAARPPKVAPKPHRAPSTRTSSPRPNASRTSSPMPSAPTSAWPPASTRHAATLAVESLQEAEALAERLSFRARSGRLAQSVRALL